MNPCQRVAIVGIGGIFPQSPTLEQFWHNVKNGIDTARDVPPGRWILSPDDAYDPEPGKPDHVYSRRGCFIEDFTLDPAGLALDYSLLAELDPMCHLALHAGRQAWQSAVTDSMPRDRVGVILGNIALPTDRSSALTREILGRTIAEKVLGHAPPQGRTHALDLCVAGLPATLLAKALNLSGGTFALDAACASSLYALKLAADELLAHRADAMLAGGVSRPDCLYTQMGFSQLRALSPSGRCAPFDASADGLVVGEGSGIFVLKRLEDALRDGDRIWAVIAGIGLSNDVHGRLLAPSTEGQLRAMRAAYEQAGWRPSDVDLIECHGTGTPVGDGVELASLAELWRDGSWQRGQCVLGSVKSNIGHTLTAAGSAGLLKVLLAMQDATLPPTANIQSSGPAAAKDGPFRVLSRHEPWRARNGIRRAAVSAFGFGGINAHVLLEEWLPQHVSTRIPECSTESDAAPIAVVGMSAHFGPWNDLAGFQQHTFGDDAAIQPETPHRWWGVEQSAWYREEHAGISHGGYYLDEITVPVDHFRIPPRELEEMLPQQLLMLKAAAGALADAKFDQTALLRTGVFIGIELDPNTTNFSLRWSLLNSARDWNDQLGLGLTPTEVDAWAAELRNHVHPPLTANRTMGALGGIVASRIAREFRIGGPSFTVSAEECSGLRAVQVAVRRLEQRELDQAIVGAVDLAGDVRSVLGSESVRMRGEGAAALVLKRLDDARRAGDRVYAVIRGFDDADTPIVNSDENVGDAGAAAGLAALVKACLCLHHERLPAATRQYWLRNRAEGPRRATVVSTGCAGGMMRITLEECDHVAPERRRPTRHAAIFVVEADDERGWQQQRTALRDLVARQPDADLDALARMWWQLHPNDPRATLGSAFVAGSPSELLEQIERRSAPPRPVRQVPRLAFVYPGSGNQFAGMGRELSAHFPDIFRGQDAESERLRDQVLPDVFWNANSVAGLDHRTAILGQVSLGAAVTDILRSCGVEPHAAIGYSLGESAALFALRAWTERDEMRRRLIASPLFVSDLAGECHAARKAWGLSAAESVDWVAGIVPCPADQVRQILPGRKRVYLLIVNTPRECVIGGDRREVEQLVGDLAAPFVPLSGVSTVHCEIARQVETAYRELHLLKTTPPAGIRFYSGANGQARDLTRESAAESIVAQALAPIDFPAVVHQAYADGVRVFLEIGPGNSCTRMIGQILADRHHLACAACVPGQNELVMILRVLAALIEARGPVDLGSLYRSSAIEPKPRERAERLIHVPVGGAPFDLLPNPKKAPSAAPRGNGAASSPVMQQLVATQTAKAEAHAAFLHFSDRLTQIVGGTANNVDIHWHDGGMAVAPVQEVALDREQCLEFAVGSIAKVLGAEFAEVDGHPTRVRLPDEPLMLVDRIVSIEATPRSLTKGCVVTEHDIHAGAWYLDAGRIPTCIAVEAGQADLFLSGYLGIDFQTKGLAVYRLLDAVVTFHRGLPGPGEVIRYEIHIDSFFRQGATYLFRFRFEGTVDGEPLLTMRDGCAGFFTAAELDAGKGIVQTDLDRRARPGVRPADWQPLMPLTVEQYDERQIDALRSGDLAGCFGPVFASIGVNDPLTIPGGRMKLVDRVVLLDPNGGRFGLGFMRAEADIHPDDWFLTCHFVDDQVMPGTLMYECCLHTLRIFLLRMGWIAANDGVTAFEPVPGVASRLKCRGQVLGTTRIVTYEVSLKEIGFRPEPYVLCDALMYADGKAIVEITDMSLQWTGATRASAEETAFPHGRVGRVRETHPSPEPADRADSPPPTVDEPKRALFDFDRILAFAVGKPSEAFGDQYRVFDEERFIARLPGPPYQVLDRITMIDAQPWVMTAGGEIEAQYDVPPDAWYFAADRQDHMPFAILLEVALQPCGWLAAYLGSALTSSVDLHFRNLGGTARQHFVVTPDIGTLTTRVRITKAAQSGGMIIQDYDFEMTNRGRTVYHGSTNFGFFSKESLAQQVGVRAAGWYQPSADELQRGKRFDYPWTAPFPDSAPPLVAERRSGVMRMIDRIDLFVPDGGPHGLGFVAGSKLVDPADWYFAAHFYLDPVCPGSLGLESFLQLLKIVAAERWGATVRWQFDVVGAHRWLYRGQVIPTNKRVDVQAIVTALDETERTIRADGYLSVDGLVIYQMNDFTLRLRSGS